MDVWRLCLAIVCSVAWMSGCEDPKTKSASAEAAESEEESGTADSEATGSDEEAKTAGGESSGDEPGASAEPEENTESADGRAHEKHHEAIARAVCPSGDAMTKFDDADFGCGQCPEWAGQRDLEADEHTRLSIHVGRFTPGAAESKRLEALVDLGRCAHRIKGGSHTAFLERRDGDWSVVRHSAKLGVGDCEVVEVAPPERTSLHCMIGGQTHQGITHGTVVSYLFDAEGWRKQTLAEMQSNGASGMGDCVTVRPTLSSVDDGDPRQTEVAVHLRGRERPRTDDDQFCARFGDDDWDDETTIRYRWNGDRFEVLNDGDLAILKRNVARTKVAEFEFEGYLEPERIDSGWNELGGRRGDGAGDGEGAASAAMAAYDPSQLPPSLELDPENVLDEGLAWTDAGGENRLVFVEREYTAADSDKPTATLLVFHERKAEDGRWKTVRDFRQTVRDCGLDLFLSPEVGPWSLTDLDDDGLKEVSFAWSNGCVGGMGPITHKVLVTEDGDKSILRGETRVTMPTKDDPDHTIGGEIREAEGFDGSEKRRDHAHKVWEATVE